MALPIDEPELKRVVEFVVMRWMLDQHFGQIQIQGLFFGIHVTKDDYLKIIRAYADKRDVNAPCEADFDLKTLLR